MIQALQIVTGYFI